MYTNFYRLYYLFILDTLLHPPRPRLIHIRFRPYHNPSYSHRKMIKENEMRACNTCHSAQKKNGAMNERTIDELKWDTYTNTNIYYSINKLKRQVSLNLGINHVLFFLTVKFINELAFFD